MCVHVAFPAAGTPGQYIAAILNAIKWNPTSFAATRLRLAPEPSGSKLQVSSIATLGTKPGIPLRH
jgi:hypothetical protein